MSLLSSIQLAGNALSVAQIGLQVTANNIANANTPEYIREELIVASAPTQRKGNLLLGLGVQADAVVQRIDQFLAERLRTAASDLASGETQEKAYVALESLIGELGETDLSTSINNFLSSVHDILNQPESVSVRNLAVLKGRTLTDDIRRLGNSVRNSRADLNDQVVAAVDDVNRLSREIAALNVRIVTFEGGDISKSDAVGLRDQRQQALAELANLVDIRVEPQESGAVSVFVGGQFLVADSVSRDVAAVLSPDRGLSVADVRLADSDSPLEITAGRLGGLVAARDDVLGNFLDNLDDFTATFVFEFNRLYASGQGLTGHSNLLSEFAVDSTQTALDSTGLEFTPVNGSFQVLVHNTQTGIAKTTDVFVRLNGLDDDTTLEELAAQLDAIDGLSGSISPERRLQLAADSSNQTFAFAADTSGVLAALGLGTFFSGSTSLDVGIQAAVRDDPSKFAASQNGIGEDSENAVQLAGFLDRPLESRNGETLADLYDHLTGEVIQASAVSHAVADGFRVFHDSLLGQHLAVSGVNLDEEALRLLNYQRLYQASARYISTVNELLDTLMTL